MPEGHSLRRLANAFNETFVGDVCELSSPQGRFEAGAEALTGRRIVAAQSVGKHLFLGFVPAAEEFAESPETDPRFWDDHPEILWLHTHLGLYGAWRFSGATPPPSAAIGAPRTEGPDEGLYTSWGADSENWEAPPPRGAVRVRILTFTAVADLNGPTRCDVIDSEQKATVIARLGPDPLDPLALTPGVRDEFVRLVRKSERPVGDLVMDQQVSAGVGNIYRAEALFRQGISPNRAGSRVSSERLRRLWDDFVLLLQRGVAEGKIRTVEPEDELHHEGDPEASRWYVYHRQGRPCLQCGNPVQEALMKGRRLFWCSTCQR